MMPGYIQGGTFAGNGVFFVGAEDRRGSPFECTVEITQSRERFMISGHYRRVTDIAKHRFSGSFSTQRRALAGPTVEAIELSTAAVGELTGVLSNAGMRVLIQAISDSGEIQISQRWDELPQEHCFSVQGVIVRAGIPPMHYSLSFGNIDPRLAKSNVVALDSSA